MARTYKAHYLPGQIIATENGQTLTIPTTDPLNADYQRYLSDGGAAVLGPADPAPLVYSGRQEIVSQIATTTATPTEFVRFPLLLLTGYGAYVDIFAIDRTNGVMKTWLFKAVTKRLGGGALAIGKQDLHPPIQEPAGAPATASSVATWDYAASVSGNDALVTATGAAGRTIDWFAFLNARRFTPGGA